MAENQSPEIAAAQPASPSPPLARVWEDPVGTGDPVPYDPNLFEPLLSAEEIKKLQEEQKKG